MTFILYMLVALIAWVGFFKLSKEMTTPRDDLEEMLMLMLSGIAALVWPFAVIFALCYLIFGSRDDDEDDRQEGGRSGMDDML